MIQSQCLIFLSGGDAFKSFFSHFDKIQRVSKGSEQQTMIVIVRNILSKQNRIQVENCVCGVLM